MNHSINWVLYRKIRIKVNKYNDEIEGQQYMRTHTYIMFTVC